MKSFVTCYVSVADCLAYLIRAHRKRLPDVMSRSESSHIYSVRRDVKQRPNYSTVLEAKTMYEENGSTFPSQ